MLNHRDHTVEEICDKSTKLITFIDLAGHQKYMKTTIFGLTGYKPHFVALVVAANMGIGKKNPFTVNVCDVICDVTDINCDVTSRSRLINLVSLEVHNNIFLCVVGTTKDHLAWAIALEVPFFVVVTKIDKTNSSKLEKTLSVLENVLKQPSYLRICSRVRSEDDALTLAASFSSTK